MLCYIITEVPSWTICIYVYILRCDVCVCVLFGVLRHVVSFTVLAKFYAIKQLQIPKHSCSVNKLLQYFDNNNIAVSNDKNVYNAIWAIIAQVLWTFIKEPNSKYTSQCYGKRSYLIHKHKHGCEWFRLQIRWERHSSQWMHLQVNL